ncbi:dihydrofolate reductase family protein [Streptomyces sp. NPDC059118]|uniref:dihydrofolate reductase family protein n=1 Tax=unclassified Streptomyces TaxID=2593676 RepID=UPI0036A6C5F6
MWRHLTESPLLARWWTANGLRVSALVVEARPGGQTVQKYRDAEDNGRVMPYAHIHVARDRHRHGRRRPARQELRRVAPRHRAGGPALPLVRDSASVIKALLAADEVDRLALTAFPVFLGGGPRLFDDALPAGRWSLVSQAAGEHGTLALVYDRIRESADPRASPRADPRRASEATR